MVKTIVCCILGIYMLAIAVITGVVIAIDKYTENKQKGDDYIVRNN